jgi:hypothetical protein
VLLSSDVAKVADELRIRKHELLDFPGDVAGPCHGQEPLVSRVDSVCGRTRDLLGVLSVALLGSFFRAAKNLPLATSAGPRICRYRVANSDAAVVVLAAPVDTAAVDIVTVEELGVTFGVPLSHAAAVAATRVIVSSHRIRVRLVSDL